MSLPSQVAREIELLAADRPLVAIDGPDAAGKTRFAADVAAELSRPVVCASIDSWHNPREVRVQRGAESPEGYFLDSFDLDAFINSLLRPFRDGAARVRTAAFAYRTDEHVESAQDVPAAAVLLVDGVFLHRSELAEFWDLSLYLHVPEEVTLQRALVRDLEHFGDEKTVRQRYVARYLPGQAMYRQLARPTDVADIVIDNSDWQAPVVLRGLGRP